MICAAVFPVDVAEEAFQFSHFRRGDVVPHFVHGKMRPVLLFMRHHSSVHASFWAASHSDVNHVKAIFRFRSEKRIYSTSTVGNRIRVFPWPELGASFDQPQLAHWHRSPHLRVGKPAQHAIEYANGAASVSPNIPPNVFKVQVTGSLSTAANWLVRLRTPGRM